MDIAIYVELAVLALIVICTVIFSVVLHGLTANSLASALASRLGRG